MLEFLQLWFSSSTSTDNPFKMIAKKCASKKYFDKFNNLAQRNFCGTKKTAVHTRAVRYADIKKNGVYPMCV